MFTSYLLWLYKVIWWGSAVILGPFGYFLSRYLHIGKSVWGNSINGYCGDEAYQNNEAKKWVRKLWPCFWWSVIRNPANNLSRRIIPEFTIKSIHRNSSRTFTTITTTDGNKLWFFYTPYWKVQFKFGYKLWNNNDFIVGRKVNTTLAFSIQRGHPRT